MEPSERGSPWLCPERPRISATACGNAPRAFSRNWSMLAAVHVQGPLRERAMNDRHLQIAAYAAAAYVCLTLIIAGAAIIDELVHIM